VKRRAFITLLGGAAAAWPQAARAQQGERVRRIGVLLGSGVDTDDLDMQARMAVFRQALQQLGWIEGRNVRIDTRFGSGNVESLRKYAAEMSALAPDVILVGGAAPMPHLLQVTRTVPIVFIPARYDRRTDVRGPAREPRASEQAFPHLRDAARSP
jgi:putative ABC transport system substrate-binding protein